MSRFPRILNEREFLRTKKELARLRSTQTNEYLLQLLQNGISPEVIQLQLDGIEQAIVKLQSDVNLYEETLKSSAQSYHDLAPAEIGRLPIIARLLSKISQKEFADIIGLKEQQIQRYEAEFFASMKLSTFVDLLDKLNVKISAEIVQPDLRLDSNSKSSHLTKKQLNFVRKHRWFDEPADLHTDAELEKLVNNLIYSSSKRVSSKALLKSNKFRDRDAKASDDQIWLAKVVTEALSRKDSVGGKFDYLRLDYIPNLLSLSLLSNGPIQVIDKLNELGLIVIVEPAIPGMAVDGAAILVMDIPVIALTIRHDRIDNFWFTLLHELGHIHLHHSKGLDEGFIDNLDSHDDSELENEANQFASEAIISSEKWRFSPARLAKNAEPIEKLARSLNIHEALIFGKVRKERGFNLFSDKIGSGKVRKLFFISDEG